MSKRAERRAHRARMIRRAVVILDRQGWCLDDPVGLKAKARRWADNLTHCSCNMCCNVRRSFWTDKDTKTRPERRQELELHEWKVGKD